MVKSSGLTEAGACRGTRTECNYHADLQTKKPALPEAGLHHIQHRSESHGRTIGIRGFRAPRPSPTGALSQARRLASLTAAPAGANPRGGFAGGLVRGQARVEQQDHQHIQVAVHCCYYISRRSEFGLLVKLSVNGGVTAVCAGVGSRVRTTLREVGLQRLHGRHNRQIHAAEVEPPVAIAAGIEVIVEEEARAGVVGRRLHKIGVRGGRDHRGPRRVCVPGVLTRSARCMR